jgi:hypothetical protein
MNNMRKSNTLKLKLNPGDRSIFVSIQNLMDFTKTTASTSSKIKQDWLAKCGKEKNERLTVGDVSVVTNFPIEYIYYLMYPQDF